MRDSGALPRLVSAGLLSPKTVTYFNITERVNVIRIRMTRTSKAVIMCNVAEEFNVSTATVYRAVSVMNTPLHIRENNGKG